MLELEEAKLHHYTIQRRLARGGMSNIYLAHDAEEQTVAMKVVHRSQSDHVARFQQEVKTLHELAHEHILPILDSGEDGSWHYCVMPYMPYGTLRDRIRKGPLSMEDAGIILDQVASALHYAHEHGILHCDIKPSNILLQENASIYLADFGLAKEIAEGIDSTLTDCLIGTPEYMAPELTEQPATISSEVYSLGVVLYQMLTGQLPFKGDTPIATCWKHLQEQPVPPTQLNTAISHAVEQVILCTLEKNPARRFSSVLSMAQAYALALQVSDQAQQAADLVIPYAPDRITLPTPVQRVVALPTTQTWHGRHPAFMVLAAAFFLLIVPFTLGFSVYINGYDIQASLAHGASAQFAKIRVLTPEVSPSSTTTVVPIVVHYSLLPSNSEQNPSDEDSDHSHWHKHGHGHGHG